MTDSDRPISICSHLAVAPDLYHVWFTGRGLDRHWVCPECAAGYPGLPSGLIDVTDELFRHCEDEGSWIGIRGQPEVKRRPSSLCFAHEDFSGPSSDGGPWIDIQPDQQSDGGWFVLLASGELASMNPRRGEFRILYRLSEIGFEIDDRIALCLSPRQDYGAICQVSNRYACAFNFKTGAITTRIDRGDYYPDVSHFPIAFFEAAERSLLVAATDWNRLDIFDPASGAVLTERGPTSYQNNEPQPPHYLDYFHAQISISSDGQWIVDNGWHWHPWGIVKTWNLRNWLQTNPWESEDGRSMKSLADRDYYWDGPLCWIDDSTVAIWGWGEDADWLIPAARLFDVRDGRELRWFPGPDCRGPRSSPPKKLAPSLFFDRYLFSIHAEQGTSVWDVTSGERLLQDPAIAPSCYHPQSKEFLSLMPGGIRLSRLTG